MDDTFTPQGILFIAAVLDVDIVISSCTDNRYGLVLDLFILLLNIYYYTSTFYISGVPIQ